MNIKLLKMKYFFKKIFSMHHSFHLVIALFIRFLLIGYSIYHDANYPVPYTDIDYKVFTDAARYTWEGMSPYERHTYRYSPLLAILLIPNLICPIFGKILFSLMDILVAILLREIITYNMKKTVNDEKSLCIQTKTKSKSKKVKFLKNTSVNKNLDILVNTSTFVWLYNPLTIAIATRGNSDSIAGFLVLATIYCIQCKNYYFVGGLIYGLAIHFRLYPIFYSLTFFLFLGNQSETCKKRKTIFRMIFPNKNQILLVLGCILSLISLIGFFYFFYGYTFVYETYLYHFIRHDTRHNFSLYFYLQYLTAFIRNVSIFQKLLVTLPQLVLLFVFSVKYGLDKNSMNFGILVETIVMVSYNTVLTSQYFVWIMAILPLCIWQIKTSFSNIIFLLVIWLVAQGAWLLPAYLLEFEGKNTFIYIWLQSVAFFCANIVILGRLIIMYKPSTINIQKTK